MIDKDYVKLFNLMREHCDGMTDIELWELMLKLEQTQHNANIRFINQSIEVAKRIE